MEAPAGEQNELLFNISFEPAESVIKSKKERIEDFWLNPIILFVTIREATKEVPWAKNYRVFDDLNDRAILCTCPTSDDIKRDVGFEKMLEEIESANENKIGFCIINWVRKHLGYKYITSLKIEYDYEVTGFLYLSITATGLKYKFKTAPPLIMTLPTPE